jgi:hypothetical protein
VLRFEILELCAPSECVRLEQRYIDSYGRNQLYNVNLRAESRLGVKLTEKQQLQLAKAHGGVGDAEVLSLIISEYESGATQT